nr:hypothetical protein [Tanacetum cinerariifolium]
IRNLQAQNDIMSLLNVGSTDDSCNKQAFETEMTQLKDTVTSLKIQNDGEDSCTKAEIATLNAKTVGNKTSGTIKPANPKVIAPGMYAISPKILEPTVEPIELSPSVSSSIKIPMLSKFVTVTLGMES